jgi:hypothetical protein
MATRTKKQIKSGEGGTTPRITDNRVMALNKWSERSKLNKTLDIKLSLHHCIMYL